MKKILVATDSGPAENQPGELRAYSPETFAAMLEMHPEYVRLAIRQGRIPAIKCGRHWRVTHPTVTHILAHGITSARPRTATVCQEGVRHA